MKRQSIKELRKRLEEAEAKANCYERSFRDIWWMARRYADGRKTYAPSMYNEAFDRVRKWHRPEHPDITASPASFYADDGDMGKWNPELGRFYWPPELRNRAQCRKCGDIIESRHVHDFVRCKCGAIFVDGGHDYIRRGGDPMDFVEVVE